MNLKTKINLIIKGIALCLSLTVIAPSIVKFTHAFSHHEHELCDNPNPSEDHFHQVDLDCEFYKFKISNTIFFGSPFIEQIDPTNITEITNSYDFSFKPHPELSSYLRGPPYTV